MNLDSPRVETLVIGRAYTMRGPASTADLLAPLARFSPGHLTSAAWLGELEQRVQSLRGVVLRDNNQLVSQDELRRRIGLHNVTSWQQLADRVLPGLGLAIAPSDAKILSKLSSAEAWAAAIVGRARGTWSSGPPPSASALSDAFAWERLGLSGKAKRLPAEVRSLFLQQELAASASKFERLLRQLAARELGIPRTDARALRDGIVRVWLMGRAIAPQRTAVFADDVKAVATSARDGVFGERKVFISEVWEQLRRQPSWSALSLEDFKNRLVAEHRAGSLMLARADFASAMNPELVASSEINASGTSFHFVVRENV